METQGGLQIARYLNGYGLTILRVKPGVERRPGAYQKNRDSLRMHVWRQESQLNMLWLCKIV